MWRYHLLANVGLERGNAVTFVIGLEKGNNKYINYIYLNINKPIYKLV